MILSNFRLNETAHQFELDVNGELAFLEFYREGDKLFLTHTEVPDTVRGQGVAAHLVKHVLQYARENGLFITPLCSYVAYYFNNNPEWSSLLSEGYQM